MNEQQLKKAIVDIFLCKIKIESLPLLLSEIKEANEDKNYIEEMIIFSLEVFIKDSEEMKEIMIDLLNKLGKIK